MNLTKLTAKDLFLHHEDDWDSRSFVHNELKNSNFIAKKPVGDYFEIEENPEDKEYISCHLMIPVVVTQASPFISQSAFLESEESEENEDENEYNFDLGIDDGPPPAESSAAKKSRKKGTVHHCFD